MAKVIDLGFLTESPEVVRVKLGGQEYGLRGVDVVEDLLVVLGAVEEFLEGGKEAVPTLEGALAIREVLLERCLDIVGRLVPEMDAGRARELFPTLALAQQAVMHLTMLVQEHAPASVKKNSGGGRSNSRGQEGGKGETGKETVESGCQVREVESTGGSLSPE